MIQVAPLTEHMNSECDCRVDGHHIGSQLSFYRVVGTFPAVYGFRVSIESQGKPCLTREGYLVYLCAQDYDYDYDGDVVEHDNDEEKTHTSGT